MEAITTKGWGLNAKLSLAQVKSPHLSDDDVLVEVHAASVNPKDWKLNYHLSVLLTPVTTKFLPPLFGDDLAGIVVSKGKNVSQFDLGDRVYGMDMRLRTASLAEYTSINQGRITHIPEHLSFQEAACVPLAAQTALQGLRKGGAKAGSSVLIIGASGGVGTFAVQIAKALGCQVTAVCSTRNIELVKSLGADEIIDYTLGDFRASAGTFDLVFDVTSHETAKSCKKLRGDNGYFISTGGNATAVLGTFFHRAKHTALIKVESYKEDLDQISQWIAASQVKVIIDSIYPLVDSQAAYERSRSGRSQGKIVIQIKS
ncbi:NAD(P)-dependent alcohol dehydrogenase [Acinetobacter populi]|uniref:Alcohol dehydrogenase n=1 Tax=Acinetobacter populi TaxID=1582270 RepID=A0A1Z9Z0V8_9GAMM|nr:NAD(P)-dependent alcohol dehydrogenase [Acinetobacter populi]OUY08098.1 alcohol dehydrogenase [Acinetobacter populi]